MSQAGATPLFIDTGAFYARADADDRHHETAKRVFDAIRTGDLAYRPLYTTQAVLSELATLCLYKLGHDDAVRALTAVRRSASFNVLTVSRSAFEAAAGQFEDYDDQEISFVDHTTAMLAEERSVDHVFAFDSDFRTLGFSLVPDDATVGEEKFG
ncbi:PIN domain containing protein [Halorhabdus sp. SVX81]|uniref:type II toxin-antitoxin system VapC family toxin n=1 Tax=Halorhabdus sp. SVX81 TaxID=2978283 RepID=UPI0023DC98E1|nr:PIN domain-containing protein [Halorhabdus sp. SVX81]WEL16329.1 PIN domain containing protein [Halorhabdus sp. SVX81]